MFLTHCWVWGVTPIFNTKNCDSINCPCTPPHPNNKRQTRDLKTKNSVTVSLNCCRTPHWGRLHVFGMRVVFTVHKRKTPRCSFSNTGPALKTEIRADWRGWRGASTCFWFLPGLTEANVSVRQGFCFLSMVNRCNIACSSPWGLQTPALPEQ